MMRSELERKSIHIFSALIPLSFLFIDRDVLLPLLLAGSIIFIAFDYFRRFGGIFRPIFIFFASWAMREPEELEHQLTGASWMMLAMSLVFLIFPVQAAIPAMLILHWCDAAAALAGKKWGRHRWTGSHTVEGSLAFILTGLIILGFGFPQIPSWAAFIAVSAAALSESLVKGVDDNFLIPIVAASIIYFFI